MAIANALNAQTAGIQGMSSPGVWTGTAATNHAVIVGGATASTLTNVGPSATAGQILQSGGAAADPVFSTATYPATAGSSGNVLTSNGTNWVSSAPASTGDVVGPASSTDNALVRFDSTTGKLIQNGVITEDDTGNLSITASVSGANLSALVSNTSNTASAQAFVQAQVAGSTAADAYFVSNISGGQNWSHGLDNSDSDAFVLSSNATLGTNNVMRVATTGEMNFPLQSAFLAYLASTALNKTGNGASYTLGTDALTEVFDQNSDFNTNGTYTAPITGRVHFNAAAELIGNTVLQIVQIQIQTSNRNYAAQVGRAANGTDLGINISILADMDANDTAIVTISGFGEAGNTDDISGVTPYQTFFSGFIAC